jgi:hypothetical protein
MSVDVASLQLSTVPPSLRLYPDDVLPLSSMLANWARRTHHALSELLESMANSRDDEYARRTRLFHWLTARQRQLGQLYAIVNWSVHNDQQLQRMRHVTQLLDTRQQLFHRTNDTLHILARRVEDTLSVATHTRIHTRTNGQGAWVRATLALHCTDLTHCRCGLRALLS